MPENLVLMKRLQELLEDERLCARIENASDVADITKLVNVAGEEKGFDFREEWIADVIVDIKVSRGPLAPTLDELRQLAMPTRPMESAPKLCHTDSCGGHPDSCC